MLTPQKILVDIGFVKNTNKCQFCKKILVNNGLQKAYKGQKLQPSKRIYKKSWIAV